MDEQNKEENEFIEDVDEIIDENERDKTNEEANNSDDKKSKEEDEIRNQLVRLQADFDNYRKRTTKEKEDIFKYAIEDFSKKLLPVIDNVERAISSIEEASVNDGYADGVKMVLSQLMDILKNEGLKEIETKSIEFDPKYHHGVTTESVEDVEDNCIIEVYQKGYTFKDKVIRPAMVKICKK